MSTASLQILIESIDKSSADIAKIRGEMDKLATSAAKAEKVSAGFSDSMKRVGGNVAKVGGVMTAAVTAPIVGGMVASAKAAIDFESAMADVNKVTGLSGIEAKAMSDEILAMSRSLPIAATGLAEIATAGGQLGIASGDLGSFVEVTAKMATAFDMSADQAGTSIAKMMNLYGVNVAGAEDLGNAVNQVSNNSSAAAGQIVDVMTRIGGMATTFGLSADESVGLAGAFITAGGTAETAGTSINGMLQTLQTATLGNETFQAGLERTGLSAVALEGAIKDNAVGGIELLLTKLNALKPEERSKAIAQMFGKGQDSALISKLAGDVDMFRKSVGLATDETARAGSMQAEFAARSATTANQMALLKNKVTEVGITLGSAMLPAINSIVARLAPMAEGLANFAQANPRIVRLGLAFAAVAAAVGPVLLAIGAVISAVGTIAGVVGPVVGMVTGAIGFIVPLVSTLGTVVGLVMGAIATAVGLPVIAVVALGAAFAAIAAAIIMNWSQVKSFFVGLVAAIGSALARASAMFSQLDGKAAAVAANIISYMANMASNVAASAMAAGQGLVSGFMSAVGGVASAMASIVSTVVGALTGLVGQAFAMGSRVVSAIADGIKSGVGKVSSAAASVASAVANLLPNSPVPEGSLKILNGRHNTGFKIAEMVAGGISRGADLMDGAMGRLTSPAVSALPTTSPSGGSASGGSTSNSFSPNVTINVNGGNPDVAGQIDRQLEATFARLYKRYQAQQSRVSYS